MLRPPAPDSSEKTPPLISRRLFLDTMTGAAVTAIGAGVFVAGMRIRRALQESQPAPPISPDTKKDIQRREPPKKETRCVQSVPLNMLRDGESLLNRPFSLPYYHAECGKKIVHFQLIKNEDGLFIEVEGQRYVCDEKCGWITIHTQVETVSLLIIQRTEKTPEKHYVRWGATKYGAVEGPLSDIVDTAVWLAKNHDKEKIDVSTSIGVLQFKKCNAPPNSLAQATQ